MVRGDSAAASKQQQKEGQQQAGDQEVDAHLDGASLGSRRAAVVVMGLHGGAV